MFGYQAGVTREARARMAAERSMALQKWPFLTSLDLSTIHGEQRLASMVKDRTGKSLMEARSDVHVWMIGYLDRIGVAPGPAISRWDNEGGSTTPAPAKGKLS